MSTESETTHTAAIRKGLRLGKSERLHHKRLVERLFREGNSFYAYPVRVIFTVEPVSATVDSFKARAFSENPSVPPTLSQLGISHLQMMTNVPKRKMHRAVDRVLLRRRIKEAWRLKRIPLRDELIRRDMSMRVGLIFMADEKTSYRLIERRMDQIIARLSRALIPKE